MWLLIFLFLLVTVIISWACFGYFIFIWLKGLLRQKRIPAVPDSFPRLSLVIPCFNEGKNILAKLENVRGLAYPKEFLEVLFADGGSSDDTVGLLADAVRPDEPFKIMQCPEAGKIKSF